MVRPTASEANKGIALAFAQMVRLKDSGYLRRASCSCRADQASGALDALGSTTCVQHVQTR